MRRKLAHPDMIQTRSGHRKQIVYRNTAFESSLAASAQICIRGSRALFMAAQFDGCWKFRHSQDILASHGKPTES
ncbi:hypothetical protein DFR33_105203 [Bradymonas sediminis]|nr:hypothetical protein DFR33_105203 [Bradymonas sediminis]